MVKDIAVIGAEDLGSISGPVLTVSSVVKRTGYRWGRSGVRLQVRSNRHSVAYGSPPLRRFCVPRCYVAEIGSQHPFLTIAEKKKLFFWKRTSFSSSGAGQNCYHVFLFCQLSNLVSRSFYSDAMQSCNNTVSPTFLMCFA